MTTTYHYYQDNCTTTNAAMPFWTYSGTAEYETDYDGYIKVDKGSPDKARYVIFYAFEKKDPMIFCKSKAEVNKEIKRLKKRKGVDLLSIRVFALIGGMKKK